MSAVKQLRTVRDWWEDVERSLIAADVFCGHGCDNPHDEAAWLVVHGLQITHEELSGALQRQVSAAQEARLKKIVKRRINERRPMAYLAGETWLGDHAFLCDERALVPRSFLAPLLGNKLAPWVQQPSAVRHILDLCTGGGSLAILAALNFPRAQVAAVDVSPQALALARENVERYKLTDRIELLAGDLFLPLQGRRFEVIVSNPPYVPKRVMDSLPEEYRHEPALGLAGGEDGLDVVRRILAAACDFLAPSGLLLVEVGHQQRQVEAAFPQTPFLWLEGGTCFCLTTETLPGKHLACKLESQWPACCWR